MTAPTPLDLLATPREKQLAAELSEERRMGAEARRQMRQALRAQYEAEARANRLDQRLAALQQENEHAYVAAYDATGGPGFDKRQPFGADRAARPHCETGAGIPVDSVSAFPVYRNPEHRAAWAALDRQDAQQHAELEGLA